jgi:hypothetical protein
LLKAPAMRLFAPRLSFAVLSAVFVVACGEVGPSDDTAQNAAALEEGFVGDRNGGADASEVDPTKLPGFAIHETPAPAKVVLQFTWKGQETGYWCGPGSVRMAIGTHLADPPSQTALADFMGTTKEGTVRADAIRALNNYLGSFLPSDELYGSIPVDAHPTQEQRDLLKDSVVRRLASGYPVIANVLSGWRPPGYPSGTIGHFVAVVGYDDNGDKVLIADPAGAGAPGPRWNDVPKSYWITMENLGTWVGGRGYSGYLPPAPPPDVSAR